MSTVWAKKTERMDYSAIGEKNKSAFPKSFIKICKLRQMELKDFLEGELGKYYGPDAIESGDGYLYVKGEIPVAVTAHMDTVHKDKVKDYYGYTRKDGTHVISSPQGIGGDDRCGVYMIMEILRTTKLRPFIIFCEDEESGGIGSNKFIKTKTFDELSIVNFFIELDRANAKDLVFYEDDNQDFHAWCEEVTGYREDYGSFSDISHFCPEIGISGVNLSCGYYNPHTTLEYVVLEEMRQSIDAAIALIDAGQDKEKFQYKSIYYGRYPRKYEDYVSSAHKEKDNPYGVTMVFYYYENGCLYDYGDYVDEMVTGESQYSCIAQFLMKHSDMSWNDVMDYEVL